MVKNKRLTCLPRLTYPLPPPCSARVHLIARTSCILIISAHPIEHNDVPYYSSSPKQMHRVRYVSIAVAVSNGVVPSSVEPRRSSSARQSSPCHGFRGMAWRMDRGGAGAGRNGGPPGLKYVGRLLDAAGVDAVEVSYIPFWWLGNNKQGGKPRKCWTFNS